MQYQSPRPAPSTASFLRSAQVAAILQVSPKTVARWAQLARVSWLARGGGVKYQVSSHERVGPLYYPLSVWGRRRPG
jgi:hypothetical protein